MGPRFTVENARGTDLRISQRRDPRLNTSAGVSLTDAATRTLPM